MRELSVQPEMDRLTDSPTAESPDRWAEWLRSRRDGGDMRVREASFLELAACRDLVLAGAHLSRGEHLLDVGTGEGLIGFGALDIVGETGHITFSDVSQELLDLCRTAAAEMGVLDRCSFVRASADAISAVADATVDAVTTRSVLIYVAAKDRAFAEFFRVLRAGGRISLFEPINRHLFPELASEFMGYDATGVEDLVARPRNESCGAKPESDPTTSMMDFDDGTLVKLAEAAGFVDIEVVLRRQVRDETVPMTWESFLASAPNPLVPTWGELVTALLSDEERERLAAHMKPRVDAGRRRRRLAIATVTAVKRGSQTRA